MLEEYLPAPPAEAEIRAAVRAAIAAGAKDLGQVMGKVMPQFKGRADGKVIKSEPSTGSLLSGLVIE